MSKYTQKLFRNFTPVDEKRSIDEVYDYARVPGRIHVYAEGKTGSYPSFSAFRSLSYEDIFLFSHSYGDDEKMTLSTFYNNTSDTISNMNMVLGIAFSVKADEIYNKYKTSSHEEVLRLLTKKNIPHPNYFIYGKEMELVYMFSEPVCLNISNSTKKRNTIQWLKDIGEKLRKDIEYSLLAFRGKCSMIPLNKGISVPGMHTKNYRFCCSKSFMTLNDHHTVTMVKIAGERLSLKQLNDLVFWEKAERKNRMEKYLVSHPYYASCRCHVRPGFFHPFREVMLNRILMLCNLAKKYKNTNAKTVRSLAFLFYNFLLPVVKININGYDFVPEERIFNSVEQKFNMDNAELYTRSKTCAYINTFTNGKAGIIMQDISHLADKSTIGSFKYKNETMFSYLLRNCGITKEECVKAGLYIADTASYDRSYSHSYRKVLKEGKIAKHETKIQQMMITIKAALSWKERGLTVREIAKRMKLSIGTIQNYLTCDLNKLQERLFA